MATKINGNLDVNPGGVISGDGSGIYNLNIGLSDLPDPTITVNLTGDVVGSGSTTLTNLANGTINISTSVSMDTIELGTDTTGDYVESVVGTNNQIDATGSGEGAGVTLALSSTLVAPGTFTSTGNADFLAGIDVTGNITVTGTVDGRDVASDGTKLDGIESGATADQTPAEILAALLTVDGSGSSLDADTVDGLNSTAFVRRDGVSAGTVAINTPDLDFIVQDTTDAVTNYIWRDFSASKLYLGSTTAVPTTRVDLETGDGEKYFHDGYHPNADDADTVDGLQASQFLRSDTGDTASESITFNKGIRLANSESGTNDVVGALIYDANFWEDTGYGTGIRSPEGAYSSNGGGLLIKGEDGWAGVFDTRNIQWATLAPENVLIGGTSQVFHDTYHPNADTLTTARDITLAGDVTGSASFDGSSDITITATVADDSHNHDTRYARLSGTTFTGFVGIETTGEGGEIQLKQTPTGKTGHIDIREAGNQLRMFHNMSGQGMTTWTFDHPNDASGSSVLRRTDSDARYVNVTGDSMSGDLTIEKVDAQIILNDTSGTPTDQSIGIRAEAIDTNLPGSLQSAIIIENASASSLNTGLVVENVIYADSNQRVFADNYHPNADTLTTARDITLSGDVTGTASFDGSANINISTTLNSTISTAEIAETNIRIYNSSDTDITALVDGSTHGTIFEGRVSGHLVMGIRDNDAGDSFSIISGNGNYATDTTYDKLIAHFQADGKIGFGTNAPVVKIHSVHTGTGVGQIIESSGAYNARLQFKPNGASGHSIGTNTNGQFSVYDVGAAKTPFRIEGNTPNNTLYVAATGNVGIGTNVPSEKLEVSGSIKLSSAQSDQLIFNGDRPVHFWLDENIGAASNDQNLYQSVHSGSKYFYWGHSNALYDKANFVPWMSLTNSKLGVGTTSALTTIHARADVSGSSGGSIGIENSIASAVGTEVGLYLAPNAAGVTTRAASLRSRQTTAGNYADLGFFVSAGTTPFEAMTISTAGRVGIGTDTPDQLLHIASTGSAIIKLEADTDNVTESDHARIEFAQDGGAVNAYLGYNNSSNVLTLMHEYADSLILGTANATRMTITSAGNVDLSGTISVGGTASRTIGPITGTYGTIQVNGGGANSWEGYSIDGRAVFMHDGGTTMGLYDDVNNKWMVYGTFLGSTNITHAGNVKLTTQATGTTTTGVHTATTGMHITSGAYTHHNTSSRDKIRVWNSSAYSIGMQSGVTFGALSDYAMTFQMSNTDARGFWWGDQNHTTATGAMSLTTQGRLTVARSLRIGYGEADTSGHDTLFAIQSNGNVGTVGGTGSAVIVAEGNGSVALTTNDGYGNANICFNHRNGVPDNVVANQSAARIVADVDNNTAQMQFQLKDNTYDGVVVACAPILRLRTASSTFENNVIVNGTIAASSDIRLKENIVPITNAVDKVKQINGVNFTYKESQERTTGVIAQDVEKVLPEAVGENDDGMKAVQYGNMVGLLIEAIKEQQKKIEELEAKINRSKEA